MKNVNCVELPQALDQQFTEPNRQRCADCAMPLIQAVEELATFASSPEFASVPAIISREVFSLIALVVHLAEILKWSEQLLIYEMCTLLWV